MNEYPTAKSQWKNVNVSILGSSLYDFMLKKKKKKKKNSVGDFHREIKSIPN